MSAVRSANNSIGDVPAVELSNCDALPASSEPVESYVVSPLMPARQDNVQCSDDPMIVETQTAECVDTGLTEHCPSGSDAGYLTENVVTTETTGSCGQNVGQSKVSDFIYYLVLLCQCFTSSLSSEVVLLTWLLILVELVHTSVLIPVASE